MFLQAKPQAYKTYIQDKDAAVKLNSVMAKSLSSEELAAQIEQICAEIDSRLSEETSAIDAELNGKKQAFARELASRQPVKKMTSEEIERYQR